MEYLHEIQNSPGMWMASSVMVLVIVVQCVLFMRESLIGAKKLGIPPEVYRKSMRAAFFSSLGPAMGPAIVMIGLVMILGVPTAWMRLCDIGSARSELGMISLSTSMIGADPNSPSFGPEGYSYAMWGMALNNVGWMLVALLLTHRMTGIVSKLSSKFSKKRVSACSAGAIIGLFAFLLTNQVARKPSMAKSLAALSAAATMLLIVYGLKKFKRLREFALGLAMVVGMIVASAI